MLLSILIISGITLFISIISLILIILVGSGTANMGGSLKKDLDNHASNLVTKFEKLDKEIQYRLPKRVYGMASDDHMPDLTQGPDDIRVPR